MTSQRREVLVPIMSFTNFESGTFLKDFVLRPILTQEAHFIMIVLKYIVFLLSFLFPSNTPSCLSLFDLLIPHA